MLEEDQAERDVLVVRRLHVAAQLVCGLEQLRLEAEIPAIAVGAGALSWDGYGRRRLDDALRSPASDTTTASAPELDKPSATSSSLTAA